MADLLDEHELEQWVKEISLQFFHRQFCHTVTYNNRLQTTAARYLLRTHALEFNPKYIQKCSDDQIVGIIKHELCHYHLHLLRKNYRHNARDFRQLLTAVGGFKYAPSGIVAVRRRNLKKG